MEKQIRKFYNFDIKSDKEDRTITCTGSVEKIDRDGEVISVKGMDLKNYKANPVVLFAHKYDSLPIAKAEKVWKSGDELKFKIKFATEVENPQAEYVYKLMKGGFINAFSIGFIPDYKEITYPEKPDGKKIPYRIIEKSELLEISVVPVPANASALISVRKTFDDAFAEGIIDKEEASCLDDDLEDYVRILEEGLKPEPKKTPVDEKPADKESDTSNEVEEKSNIYEDLLNVFNEDGSVDSKHTSNVEEVDYEEMLDILNKEEK